MRSVSVPGDGPVITTAQAHLPRMRFPAFLGRAQQVANSGLGVPEGGRARVVLGSQAYTLGIGVHPAPGIDRRSPVDGMDLRSSSGDGKVVD